MDTVHRRSPATNVRNEIKERRIRNDAKEKKNMEDKWRRDNMSRLESKRIDQIIYKMKYTEYTCAYIVLKSLVLPGDVYQQTETSA